jgi:hypothetical protein
MLFSPLSQVPGPDVTDTKPTIKKRKKSKKTKQAMEAEERRKQREAVKTKQLRLRMSKSLPSKYANFFIIPSY